MCSKFAKLEKEKGNQMFLFSRHNSNNNYNVKLLLQLERCIACLSTNCYLYMSKRSVSKWCHRVQAQRDRTVLWLARLLTVQHCIFTYFFNQWAKTRINIRRHIERPLLAKAVTTLGSLKWTGICLNLGPCLNWCSKFECKVTGLVVSQLHHHDLETPGI